MRMGRSCGYKPGNSGVRWLGVALMVIGLLIFLIFVPRWVWTSALGICLISAGFLLWRFGD